MGTIDARGQQGCSGRGRRQADPRSPVGRAQTSTVSSESSPRSLMKCEVAVTLAGSTFWKFLTTSNTRDDTSSFGRNPPDANERDHSAGATRNWGAVAVRGAIRIAVLTSAVRAELRSAARDDIASKTVPCSLSGLLAVRCASLLDCL